CNLQPKDAAKMPESAWKLLFYSLSWSYGVYLLFCTDYPFFHDPPSVFYGMGWMDGGRDGRATASVWGEVLVRNCGCKAWEKLPEVFPPSWGCLCTKPLGCAAALPFPRSRDWDARAAGGCARAAGGCARAAGGCAGSVPCQGDTKPPLSLCPGRFWFRLYWFPLKVLYATCHSSLQSVPNIPFYFFFNALLLVLTLMNIYWFLYIVLFVAKVLLGQMQEVNDVREYDVEESRNP
ncbi:CERS1 synthase, partial [Chaetorhynchus papuensis]|nr:CERS1 synthase [Chaetorhynchus papuensis]